MADVNHHPCWCPNCWMVRRELAFTCWYVKPLPYGVVAAFRNTLCICRCLQEIRHTNSPLLGGPKEGAGARASGCSAYYERGWGVSFRALTSISDANIHHSVSSRQYDGIGFLFHATSWQLIHVVTVNSVALLVKLDGLRPTLSFIE